MTEDLNKQQQRLRAKAEAIYAWSPPPNTVHTSDQTKSIQHNLAVHQIELEIQNEELQSAQRQIERARDCYARLYHNAPVGYLTLSANGLIQQFNQTFWDMIGKDKANLAGQPFFSLIPSPEHEIFLGRFKAFFKNPEGKILNTIIKRKDGQTFPAQLTGRVEAGALFPQHQETADPFLLVIVSDISEQRRLEEERQQAHQKTFSILESIKDAFFSLDNNLVVTYFNTAAEQALNRRREEVLGQPLFEAFPEARGSIFERNYTQALHDQIPCSFETYFGIAPYANWYAVRVYPYTQGISVYFEIITERKQAEVALQESQERFQALFEGITDAVYVHAVAENGKPGQFLEANQVACTMLGYTQREFLQMSIAQIEAPEATVDIRSAITEILAGRSVIYEQTHVAKDGRKIPVEIHAHAIKFHGQKAVLATARDISTRKSLEAQLRHAQKMEAIGRLAGGVAHDYNNILASTMMNLSLLRENPNFDEETQTALEELWTNSQRAANLTRQLLMFGRRSMMEVKAQDLNEVITNLLNMLRRLIGEHIDVKFEGQADLPLIAMDTGMMEQVVTNLTVNARDAMPRGGQLTIKSQKIKLGAEKIGMRSDQKPGLFVCLSVTDTGCGMDNETLKQIFEPFFTTKDIGKGTGLGLATVDGIIAQHSGWLEVESKVNQGTTFRIYLPALTEKIEDENRAAPVPIIPRGHETILLVEDEAMVRRMLAKCLRHFGYQVIEASNGREAMLQWDKHGSEIKLVLTDMVMPGGITGLDLAINLRRAKPNVKVIISSGYNDEIAQQGIPNDRNTVFLAKPYESHLLAKTLRECLDQE